jgi:hypothetical protein
MEDGISEATFSALTWSEQVTAEVLISLVKHGR